MGSALVTLMDKFDNVWASIISLKHKFLQNWIHYKYYNPSLRRNSKVLYFKRRRWKGWKTSLTLYFLSVKIFKMGWYVKNLLYLIDFQWLTNSNKLQCTTVVVYWMLSTFIKNTIIKNLIRHFFMNGTKLKSN